MLTHEDYKTEDPEIKRLFDSISTTITFISQAYAMYDAICFSKLEPEDGAELKNEIFTLQAMSLQFFLVVQFCKLFETNKTVDQGDSSLRKLNNALQKKYKQQYHFHSSNNKLIKDITKSEIFIYIDQLRNKAYAHGDNHPLHTPLRFVFLIKEQTEKFKEILLKSIHVYKECLLFYNIGTTFHNWYDSSSPHYFIKGYIRNKKFFLKHYKDFPDKLLGR